MAIRLELGAGGGLVGLAVAMGCQGLTTMFLSDQEGMLSLMKRNISLNQLESQVHPIILNWGDALPKAIVECKPNIILAADCVYFEPAFPLLLKTLEDLFAICSDAVVYFCFKRRRRADLQFMKSAKKRFVVADLEDQDRPVFSREQLFLCTMTKRH